MIAASLFSDFIENGLSIVAKNQKIDNPEFNFIAGSAQGFIGSMKRCCITNGIETITVIIKSLPDNDEQNRKYNSYQLFEREVFVYQFLLPELEKIQFERGLKFRDAEGFWSYPKCYYSIFNREDPQKSFLILEDLTEDKFGTKCQFTPSDFEHTRQTLIILGKLHAVSFALKVIKPEVFADFRKLTEMFSIVMTTDTMNAIISRNIRLASDLFDNPEEQSIRDKILSFKDNLWAQVSSAMPGEIAEPYAVMCHGDCWINNAMFNYGNGIINETRFVDWQMTRFGSAASEIMYYFFTCNDKPLRDQHMYKLVEEYYKAFENLLKKFNLNPEELYPLKALRDQMVKFGKYAFAMMIFVMPLMSKYPVKLFEDKKAVLTEEEKKAVQIYNKNTRGHILDLIAMGAL